MNTEASERLQRTFELEQEFYSSHPDLDNVSVVYYFHHGDRCSRGINREGNLYVSFNRFKNAFRAVYINTIIAPSSKKRSIKKCYQHTCFWSAGGAVHKRIHQLVADLFLDNNDPTKTQLDHLDSNIYNNSYTNLERVTPQENTRRKFYSYYAKLGRPVPERFLNQHNYSLYLKQKQNESKNH